MKISELQEYLKDRLNAVEALKQGGCKAFAEDSRHQSPLSETYRVSFETMRSVSLQSIWLFRFMSETVRVRLPQLL